MRIIDFARGPEEQDLRLGLRFKNVFRQRDKVVVAPPALRLAGADVQGDTLGCSG